MTAATWTVTVPLGLLVAGVAVLAVEWLMAPET
jgi:hypothetical protein